MVGLIVLKATSQGLYPNGRWGDSQTPSYGALTDYQVCAQHFYWLELGGLPTYIRIIWGKIYGSLLLTGSLYITRRRNLIIPNWEQFRYWERQHYHIINPSYLCHPVFLLLNKFTVIASPGANSILCLCHYWPYYLLVALLCFLLRDVHTKWL